MRWPILERKENISYQGGPFSLSYLNTIQYQSSHHSINSQLMPEGNSDPYTTSTASPPSEDRTSRYFLPSHHHAPQRFELNSFSTILREQVTHISGISKVSSLPRTYSLRYPTWLLSNKICWSNNNTERHLIPRSSRYSKHLALVDTYSENQCFFPREQRLSSIYPSFLTRPH